MAKRLNKRIALAFSILFSFAASAQNEVAMADEMRENGKIYVVVAVLAIIFVGIVVYLISIDRKTNALQKQLEDLKK
jgi:CcmD family protein